MGNTAPDRGCVPAGDADKGQGVMLDRPSAALVLLVMVLMVALLMTVMCLLGAAMVP